MTKFIDANIFIERWSNPKAREFTNSLNSKEHCTSTLVLAEVYHKLEKKNITNILEYIRAIMGAIKVYDITQNDLFNAIKNPLKININDKIHIETMKRNNVRIIISFDKDFDKEKSVFREEL